MREFHCSQSMVLIKVHLLDQNNLPCTAHHNKYNSLVQPPWCLSPTAKQCKLRTTKGWTRRAAPWIWLGSINISGNCSSRESSSPFWGREAEAKESIPEWIEWHLPTISNLGLCCPARHQFATSTAASPWLSKSQQWPNRIDWNDPKWFDYTSWGHTSNAKHLKAQLSCWQPHWDPQGLLSWAKLSTADLPSCLFNGHGNRCLQLCCPNQSLNCDLFDWSQMSGSIVPCPKLQVNIFRIPEDLKKALNYERPASWNTVTVATLMQHLKYVKSPNKVASISIQQVGTFRDLAKEVMKCHMGSGYKTDSKKLE